MKSEDIAKLAGVSRSTVSRVINNYPNVPEATREKVMQIVQEYNYMPNTFARTLAGKRSNTIGLFFVVFGENIKGSRIAQNDYFTNYLNYLVDFANGKDYYVLINTIREDKDYEKVNQAFLEKRIDGAIIVGTQEDTLEKIHLDRIHSSLVIFDYDIDKIRTEFGNTSSISVINTNDYEGIDKAVIHLKDLGHKNIGFIKGNMLTRSANVRFDAFKKVMKLNGLKYKQKYIVDGDFSRSVAYKNVKEAIENGNVPTAYISSNDYMAFSAIEALCEAGYSVPDDVSVIGFDNTHISEHFNPTLTTLEPKFLEMSRKSVEMLDLLIQGHGARVAGLMEYGVDMLVRNSCGKVKESTQSIN